MKKLKHLKSFESMITDTLRNAVLKLENNRKGHCSGDVSVGHCSGFKEDYDEDEDEENID